MAEEPSRFGERLRSEGQPKMAVAEEEPARVVKLNRLKGPRPQAIRLLSLALFCHWAAGGTSGGPKLPQAATSPVPGPASEWPAQEQQDEAGPASYEKPFGEYDGRWSRHSGGAEILH